MVDESMDTMSGLHISIRFNYTNEGDCLYGYRYGQTTLVDSNTKAFLLTFDSLEEAKDFAIPLRYFHKKQYVNDILFVNEENATKIEVAVKNIGLDMMSYIDTRIAKMDDKKPDSWYQYLNGDYHKIYRRLALSSILSQKNKFFDILNVLDHGTILIGEDMIFRFNKLEELKNFNPSNVDRSSTIIDLGNTIDYFLTRGAIDVIETSSWEQKMNRFKVPLNLSKFNLMCKNWGSQRLKEPVQWVQDTSTLWSINEIVEWIYRIYDLVKLRKSDTKLVSSIDICLRWSLKYKVWIDFIPLSGPTRDVLTECERVRIAHEKISSNNKKFEFYNLVTFYRYMFEHYRVNQMEVEDYAVYKEIGKYYVSIDDLCNIMISVLGNIF